LVTDRPVENQGGIVSRFLRILLLLGPLPLQCFAWGGLGHQVTAAIAESNLEPKVRAQVEAILGREKFAESSIWADTIRGVKGWHHVSLYHFIKVPDGSSYVENLATVPRAAQAQGDVMMAILKAESGLRNEKASAEEKSWNLKFLIHFLSDLHQPLHTGRPEDSGGNRVNVNWFGANVNLHKLWDSRMSETAHAAEFKGKSIPERVKWYADYLNQRYQPEVCNPDLAAWATEAQSVRAVAYSGVDGDNKAYMQKALPVLEEQMARAGFRLACLINSSFTQLGVVPAPEWTLREAMNQAVHGSFEDLVRLAPKSSGRP
jgi:hypothetical protein